jgi:hypothetical protein
VNVDDYAKCNTERWLEQKSNNFGFVCWQHCQQKAFESNFFFFLIYFKEHFKHSMVHSNYLQFIKSIIVTLEAFVCQKKTVKDNLSFFRHPISIAINYEEFE